LDIFNIYYLHEASPLTTHSFCFLIGRRLWFVVVSVLCVVEHTGSRYVKTYPYL